MLTSNVPIAQRHKALHGAALQKWRTDAKPTVSCVLMRPCAQPCGTNATVPAGWVDEVSPLDGRHAVVSLLCLDSDRAFGNLDSQNLVDT